MAKDDASDVLMTFIVSGTTGVPAECLAKWDTSDTTMMADFSSGSVFEVEDFSFGAGVESDEKDDDRKRGTAGSGTQGLSQRSGDDKSGSLDGKSSGKSGGGKFRNYVSFGSVKGNRIEVQEISITRQVDKGSPTFLKNCLNLTPFAKAVLVKRKFTGNHDYHEAFLRIEFKEPLITSVDWDESEVLKEKIKFVCRGVTIAYKPQKEDGSLDVSSSMTWESNAKAVTSSS